MRATFLASIRYLTVGLLNTAVGLGIIYFCMWALGLGEVASNAIGYGIGVVLSFFLNRRWTFTHSGPQATAFVRFLIVLAVAYCANLATVIVAVDLLGINGYLAQAMGVPPYTVVGFLGSRFYAFAPASDTGAAVRG